MYKTRTLKPSIIGTLLLLLGLFFIQSACAQTVRTMTMTLDENSPIFMLKEVGGIITEAADTIKVQMVMPPDNRPMDYKNVDIQAGDIIKMANGKKIESVKSLEDMYKSLAIGDELKLGLIRGKEMKIVTLVKGDESKMPGQMMMIKGGGEGGDIVTGLVDAGLLLKVSDNQLIVEDILEQIKMSYDGPAPEAGDIIEQLNGQTISSSEKLEEVYGAIEVGKKADLKILRNGQELKTSFTKPEAGAMRKTVMKKGDQ
ncbi:MAG: PDZ domain-containing protein [Candidatus Zixiibacteriota bacterium]